MIEDLRAEVRRVLALGGALDPDEWNVPSRCEGWSVADVFAHLAGDFARWGRWLDAALAGETDPPYPLDQQAADNALLLEEFVGMDPTQLLEALEARSAEYLGRAANVHPSVPQGHPRGLITVGDQIVWAAAECAIHGWDVATALERHWDAPDALPRIYNIWLRSPLPELPDDEPNPWHAILRASGRSPLARLDSSEWRKGADPLNLH